ncbi:MAG: glycoside hydrolase family 88/105 protein [Bacillota bacterium]
MIQCFIENYLANYKNYKDKWNYEDGCVLKGAEDLYKVTKDENYYEFIYKYMTESIDSDGSIRNYNMEDYNIDNINSGKVLFGLYEKTKDIKYRKAMDALYTQLKSHPRTESGGFWHKKIYPHQIWLDGLYMAQPFYIQYEILVNNRKSYKDTFNQFMNVRKLLRNSEKELYYHGCDESRQEVWASKETGVSACFWGRAMGWYVMALIDVLEKIPKDLLFEYEQLILVFKEAIDGLLKYQDRQTGMWYQVIDQGEREGNYLEASATLMMAYTLLKGARLGFLPRGYKEYGKHAFQGTIEKYLIATGDKFILDGICGVAGLGNTPYRDGSYEYYISEQIIENDPKGVGALMMAYSEMLLLEK